MKQTQRLDYARLTEVLHERRMADLESIRELLHQGGAFPEALVSTSLVADWDLSRVVCEIFSLPFLPVELVDPDPAAREGIDKQFLIQHGLIPMAVAENGRNAYREYRRVQHALRLNGAQYARVPRGQVQAHVDAVEALKTAVFG